jgi:Flp pilus assembly protein CpaB
MLRDPLRPLLRDRLRARPAQVNRLRKVLACLLALLAAAGALWPSAPPPQAVVTARDLAPGVALTEADLRLVPLAARPAGVLDTTGGAVGRALTSAARAGEPLTDVRLAAADPDAVSVAVRLADAGVADLLRPGSRVDVIGPEAEVLAENAAVVTVREAKPDRLVVITLSRRSATRIAAVSLEQPVAVTLR